MILEWHGPYTFRQLMENEPLRDRWGVSGVYLWIDETKPDRVAYVGKASGKPTLVFRQFNHYSALLGAGERIPAHARQSNEDWYFNFWNKEVIKIATNEDDFVEIVREGFRYAQRIRISAISFILKNIFSIFSVILSRKETIPELSPSQR